MIVAPYGQIPGAWPTEIGYAYGPSGTYLCPYDPQYNTRGEPGMYYDTPLGGCTPMVNVQPANSFAGLGLKPGLLTRWRMRRALRGARLGQIPSDRDLATIYPGYMPMDSGWIAANGAYAPGGYTNGGYNPPGNWNPAGAYGVTPGATDPMRQGFAGYFGDDGTTVIDPSGTITSPAPVIVSAGAPATSDDVIAALNDHNAKMFTLTVVSTLAVTISALLTAIRTSRLLKEDEKLLKEMERKA